MQGGDVALQSKLMEASIHNILYTTLYYSIPNAVGEASIHNTLYTTLYYSIPNAVGDCCSVAVEQSANAYSSSQYYHHSSLIGRSLLLLLLHGLIDPFTGLQYCLTDLSVLY
jgi:hypothetical protein